MAACYDYEVNDVIAPHLFRDSLFYYLCIVQYL